MSFDLQPLYSWIRVRGVGEWTKTKHKEQVRRFLDDGAVAVAARLADGRFGVRLSLLDRTQREVF